VLYSKASVIGKCDIGENVILGANSLAINENIENNSVYIGNPLENRIQFNSINIRETFFEPINNSATGSNNGFVE
jgi:serine O-acetyltransferase